MAIEEVRKGNMMTPISPFLFLSEEEMAQSGVNDAAQSVDVAEEVFHLLHRGDYIMGGPNRNNHGMILSFPQDSPFVNMPLAGPDRRFAAMPAYLGGRFDICGIKWYGSNAENKTRGLPRSVLTVMLNDKSTGEPIALLAAGQLSAARTGAIPAVASRYLPYGSPRILAVIGCGVINRYAVRAILSQHSGIERVICHNRSRHAAETFSRWLQEDYGLAADVVDSAAECVRNADLVTIAASRSAPLVLEPECFAENACILLSGPMQSSERFWLESRVVFDHIPLHQEYVSDARRSADVAAAFNQQIGGPVYHLIEAGKSQPLERFEDIGGILETDIKARAGRTVFVASGMAVFDVALASVVLDTARSKGLGTSLELWGGVDIDILAHVGDRVLS